MYKEDNKRMIERGVRSYVLRVSVSKKKTSDDIGVTNIVKDINKYPINK